MDTVWIRLTTVTETDNQSTKEQEECFMFGPTGIVRFKAEAGTTQLLNSAKVLVAEVTEEPEFIMDVLRKMRGTEGKLDAKQNKKTKSKRKTSNTKKTR